MCNKSGPVLTAVSHLFVVVVTQTPSQNLLFPTSLLPSMNLDFLCLFFLLCLQHFVFSALSVFHSAHWLITKPDQLALDASLRALRGPSSHPLPPSCPLVSLPAESKGCGGLKGRTPDGHRHVGHALCDGAWLRALQTSHSCQSQPQKVLRIFLSLSDWKESRTVVFCSAVSEAMSVWTVVIFIVIQVFTVFHIFHQDHKEACV